MVEEALPSDVNLHIFRSCLGSPVFRSAGHMVRVCLPVGFVKSFFNFLDAQKVHCF